MYHTAANVTGVLIARATGKSFGDALRERVCEPLGMTDTGFSVPSQNISRLATAYQPDATGELVVEDGPDGYWSRPPAFEEGGGGIVSTASDFLAFASALLAGGTHDGEQVLSRESVTLMTSDHLTPAQKAVSGFGPATSTTSAGVLGCRSAPSQRTSAPGRSRTLRLPRLAATDGPAYTAPAGTTTRPRTWRQSS